VLKSLIEIPYQHEQLTFDFGRWYKFITADAASFGVPSLTTVLGKTKDEESQQFLAEWQYFDWFDATVQGLDETTAAASIRVGQEMHTLTENYFLNGEELPVGKTKAHKMFNTYYDNFLKQHPIIPLMIEAPLYWTGKNGCGFGGTVDLIAQVGDEIWLIDHKTSGKRKKEDHQSIPEYKMQVVAYAKALKDLFGITVDRCMINISTTRTFTSFEVDRMDMKDIWQDFYSNRLLKYFEGRHNESLEQRVQQETS